jgi:hypothetical protein
MNIVYANIALPVRPGSTASAHRRQDETTRHSQRAVCPLGSHIRGITTLRQAQDKLRLTSAQCDIGSGRRSRTPLRSQWAARPISAGHYVNRG